MLSYQQLREFRRIPSLLFPPRWHPGDQQPLSRDPGRLVERGAVPGRGPESQVRGDGGEDLEVGADVAVLRRLRQLEPPRHLLVVETAQGVLEVAELVMIQRVQELVAVLAGDGLLHLLRGLAPDGPVAGRRFELLVQPERRDHDIFLDVGGELPPVYRVRGEREQLDYLACYVVGYPVPYRGEAGVRE